MHRIQFQPKMGTESSTRTIDMSGLVPFGTTLAGAAVSCAVYSGTDPNPNSFVGGPVVNAPYSTISVPLYVGGVAGTIYSISVDYNLSDGSKGRVTGLLAVIQDPI